MRRVTGPVSRLRSNQQDWYRAAPARPIAIPNSHPLGSGNSPLSLRTCVSGRYADLNELAITGFKRGVQILDKVPAALDRVRGLDLGQGAPCDSIAWLGKGIGGVR
jgi:hypothetical protein